MISQEVRQLNSVQKWLLQKKIKNVQLLILMVYLCCYILGTSFIHITIKDIVVLATTKVNVNVAMTL
jgi:hypothetical protein